MPFTVFMPNAIATAARKTTTSQNRPKARSWRTPGIGGSARPRTSETTALGQERNVGGRGEWQRRIPRDRYTPPPYTASARKQNRRWHINPPVRGRLVDVVKTLLPPAGAGGQVQRPVSTTATPGHGSGPVIEA
ncbi:hypothetical protein MAPG_09142 [Magnaporthiopsis poae ATCC 64411]|uniref:Uncharacterized protein n=1 Tax=Magnaporthiopsis poae (strain ATCC 64411 / 73-15) TaxID=644358 RepID=A0A0C4E963_MAGP6|nr:hypothetical protein MAPG_09142 [Magnaporthiopsis poae ATCC 64411]